MASKHHFTPTALRISLFRDVQTFSELENRIASLPTTKERGDAFEVFAEAYLATQKISQAIEVWPEQTAPVSVQNKLSLPDTDQGVDGVLQTISGELNAYQVKFRSRRRRLLWGKELSTFMGLTDQADQRVLFTNCDDLPEVMNERSRFYCIRGADLDRLTPEDFKTISDWLATGQARAERYSPLPHQREALDAILGGLREQSRVTSVMACGTGKTLVALWLAEEIGHKRIIVLLPSLALVRQTLHEWLKQTRWDRMKFRAVCSDASVSRGADDLIVQQSDLDFRVNTNPEEIREFLQGDSDAVRVVFTTYQSAPVVAAAMDGAPAFDLGIFDEAHKTAGRQGTNFAFALSDDNLTIDQRVFLTATPRHYDIRKKDKEGDLKAVFSMDDPQTYGPIVHTLPFAEAARRGIICDYKVIISVVTSDMVDDELLKHGEVVIEGDVVSARQVAHQIALTRACEEHGLSKLFTFHTTVKTAREFTGDGGASIRTHLPDFETFHVSGDMRTADREKRMVAFREADKAVMSNARCLTEGVDVPAVDMVAFMSPKKSKVDIVQATGRAMRKSPNKAVGYVMVPLYVEVASGEEIEDALERTDFGDIWDVLQAMKEQDDVLADIIRELKVQKGRTGGIDHNRTRERIEVLGPEVGLERLRSSIETALVDRLGVSWDERFGQLLAYKAEQGDCNVPQSSQGYPQLGTWVNTQRTFRKRGKLEQERIRRLEEIGFVWDPIATAWETRFAELLDYNAEHGNCNVPASWADNPQLGAWVSNQRTFNKRGTLEQERISRLEEIGFVWDTIETAWETRFAELRDYKAEHGDCKVPRSSADHPQLGTWITAQRTLKKRGKLEQERIRRLEEIGFVWDPYDTIWDEMFAELLRYKSKHGDCDVPPRWSDNPQLGAWVMTQRAFNKRGTLEQERISRLEEIGITWHPRDKSWEPRFAELLHYKVQHGHCNIPAHWQVNPRLAAWVNTQRTRRKRGQLDQEQISCLDEIGFEWDPYNTAWDVQFAKLLDYKAAHGNCNVPRGGPDNPQLGTWVNKQRQRRKQRQLDQEQISRLEEIGFEWDPNDTIWDARFAELLDYKAVHGDCNVPRGWPDNPQLGAWVGNQRAFKKRRKLKQERIHSLQEIGFVWDPRQNKYKSNK